jgi:2-oxoglutarate dehydrogenase E2 component (dihydrolipoamide succinyltransferase)
MIIDVIMPKMGESLQEGTIIKWTKKVGEKIERDETILEISTDKVDTEVPSPVAGILKSILFKENDTVEVGTKIAEIETDTDAKINLEKNEALTEKTQSIESDINNIKLSNIESEVKETLIAEKNKQPFASNSSNENLIDVVMPKMGESLQEGTIIKWTKKVGEKIERDETILEISTDKVDTEVPSPVAGVLFEILAKENDTVEVGKVIARISTGESSNPVQTTTEPISSIRKEVENIQSTIPEPKPNEITIPENYDIPFRDGEHFFSPLVREIAKQNKVSLEELKSITGSGSDGRITKEDLLKFINSRKEVAIPTKVKPELESKLDNNLAISNEIKINKQEFIEPIAKTLVNETNSNYEINPIFKAAGDYEVIRMERIRQLISEHMIRSKSTSAHVTSVAEADVTEIVKFREKYKDEFFKKYGFKLNYTPFFALATVEGIKQFPNVNVGVDGNNIIKFKHINLSIATALDDGNLIVPVIKNAEQLNLIGIASQIYELSSKARNKKLNPEDIQGGTFSVTNVGTFGTLFGTPVINQPQTAIMGIGAIQKRPVVKEIMGNDLILVRHMAYISITYDHRVIDGMLAGQCLSAIQNALEAMNENTLQI